MIQPRLEIDELIAGTYKELDKIGQGGFGHVYKGEHRLMNQKHAIKIQDINKSNEREIEMLVEYKHETILPVIYAYITNTQMVSIHPLYESNLEEVLKHPISLCLKVKLFQSVLNGVLYLHSHKAAHLDLKPANILVSNNNRCILADFGLTKIIDNTKVTLSTRLMTPSYASPERMDTAFRSDFADDVFALACILYGVFENGTHPNSAYLRNDSDTCNKNGSLPFYKDVLYPGLQLRKDRISLREMITNFQDIALRLLLALPDDDEQ